MRGFEGFDVTGVVEVRIRSYTLGPGNTAQLSAIGLEVWRSDSAEPELVDVSFQEAGPTLAAAQAVVAAVNRRLRERRVGEG